ncbi:ribose 5-phosphate isomerase B [Peptoniphilus sp. AGMB00490]|uniref:Ribose 5-phosphate isomerase B n=2 Tax=Peptoniphilus TaxID=162289 RepID=A0ACD6B001_9FIRM|nr:MULTISPECIES: ribose 5-phosphate isomerase B [Peptoniphilus]NMW85217.1 ribose 5-phosphate isomerase B [Peptoniphilus faecalis]OLR65563.1 ribose 5-phosphate isomerase B [Peptoniphilus porci]
MKIAIGSDHAGFYLKKDVIKHLEERNIEVKDMGPFDDNRVDYPDYGHAVGHAVIDNEMDFGIVICGSGIGISISANKVKGIRAALCSEPYSAKLARRHNDANVLAMGARLIGHDMAIEIVEAFLNEKFEGGRHINRVNKIEEE